jgi:ABC-type Fe3+ transport system permease subunit
LRLQTFRYVTLLSIRTALVAGALLSFALSFDEIAVTFFLAGADTTTLPLWILGAFRNTQNVPEVNAAATVILVISLPMIAVAAYLMREEGSAAPVRQKWPRCEPAGPLAVVLGHELRARRGVLAFGAVHDRLVGRRPLSLGIVRQGLYVGRHAVWTKHAVRG